MADEVCRRRAEFRDRPDWQVALDDLCMANYGNAAFWVHLRAHVLGHGDVTDEDLETARQNYAKRCRVCGSPMRQDDVSCGFCGAHNPGPEVIKGTTVAVELES